MVAQQKMKEGEVTAVGAVAASTGIAATLEKVRVMEMEHGSMKKTIENITRIKEKTVNDLRHQLEHVNNLLNESTEREKEMRMRMREVESESGSHSKTIADLEKKLAEMDKRLSDEQSLRRSLLDDKDRQLEMYQIRERDLFDDIARLMAENTELADAKAIDMSSAKRRTGARSIANASMTDENGLNDSTNSMFETRTQERDRLEKKLAEMDKRLSDEQSLRRSLLDDKDGQLERYSDYESLLCSEESRLNLSQRSSPQVTKTTVSRIEESSSRSGVKRLIDGDDIGRGVRYSHYKARIESSHKTPIKIVEAVETGEYIKLENESDEDIKVAGWTLKSINEGQETSYKFHTKTVIPANAAITVYSKDSGAKNAPPSYAMKNYNWPGGRHPMVFLSDAKNEVMATFTTVTDQASLNGDSVDPNERCAIM